MMTSLRPDDFLSPVQTEAGIHYSMTDPVHGEIRDLDPGTPARLTLHVSGISDSEAPTILIQDTPQTISSEAGLRASLTVNLYNLDPDLPPTFAISGWRPEAAIDARLTVASVPTGPARLKVLALLPPARSRSAILGSAILGSFLLPNPAITPSWFTLGVSKLGQARLAEQDVFHTWQDITGPATNVQIERGIVHNGISGQGDLGTLTADLYQGLNPRALGLIRGTPIRAIDAATRRRLFTGYLDHAPAQTRTPTGEYRYTLSAVDTMVTLAAIKRYQLTPPAGSNSWHWHAVMDELLTKHGIAWRLTGPPQPGLALGPTATEGTVTSYLDMYLATSAISWWIDRDSIVTAAHVLPDQPLAVISDRDLETALPVLHHIAETVTFDTSSVISTIEIRNHYVETDPETRERRPAQMEITVRNDQLAATYGERSATIDTAAARYAEIEAFARQLLEAYQPHPVIDSARFTPYKGNHSDEAQLNALTGLDILDPIESRMLGETALAHITRIRHHITPTSWQTTLNLTERRP